MNWGPWQYDSYPNVGDYIQLDWTCKCLVLTLVTQREEGFVAQLDETSITLIPDADLCRRAFILRWRKSRPPSEIKEEERELENV